LRVRHALYIGASIAVQYALVVFNMRAVAKGSYPFTIGTDAIIAANGLFLTRAAVKADTLAEKVAYVVGGCIGSAASLWLSQRYGL